MRAAVKAGFRPYTSEFEGVVAEMYVDSHDPPLVTCGVGNLIDPLVSALAVPWLRRSDGQRATTSEIVAEWQEVKNRKLAWYPRRPARPLYLDDAGLDYVFGTRLDGNELYLARRWATWASWPADAQMGAHSIAWAAGPGWQAPHFDALAGACTADGFRGCAGKAGYDPNDPANRGAAWLRDTRPEDDARGVHQPTLNPGLRPRNVANQWLFQNAACVLASGLDPDKLYWPMKMDA